MTDLVSPHGLTSHDIEIARLLPGTQLLWLINKNDELSRLGFAMAMAGYMAECQTDEPELFSKATSALREEEWNYALRFCPYHAVDAALTNLDLIGSALEEACIGLNAAKAGMETAMDHSSSRQTVYRREQSKATFQLLNFGALYASYVDVCRRIRGHCGLDNTPIYDRAINRIIARNKGAHSFAKDLRNFTLHYHIPEPTVTIRISDHRTASLLLDGSALLFSGYKWKAGSRVFLQSTSEIDVLESATAITRDVVRLVNFHKKLVSVRLARKKFAYDTYSNERARFRQLSNAVFDLGAAFRRPTSLMSRLLDAEFVGQVLKSSLSDESAERILLDFANRHQNLPGNIVDGLKKEVKEALVRRPRFPTGGAFLSRQKFE